MLKQSIPRDLVYGASHLAVLVHSCCSRPSAVLCSDLPAHKDSHIVWP